MKLKNMNYGKNKSLSLAIIIFSKDRAMQLHATLSSLEKHIPPDYLISIFVLYKSDKYQYQYDQLVKEFKRVSFLSETVLVKQISNIASQYDYLAFVVDDTIFYQDFNLEECIYHLSTQSNALGFSLRLGQNINWWHIGNYTIKCPKMLNIVDNYYRFKWPGEQKDFGYPLEVSSSIYRTSDIIPLLKRIYGDPGSIESHFNQQKDQFVKTKPYLLCYNKSVAFAAPINIVRTATRCPYGRNYHYSISDLAKVFDEGARIDISNISETINACHQEVELKFI